MCLVHLYIHHVWLSSLAYGKYLIDVDPKNVCYIGKKKNYCPGEESSSNYIKLLQGLCE